MFHKYQHIERLGVPEVDGILMGTCYVFPKIDGTNSSVWFDRKVCCGSRNRDLETGEDNHGFREWVSKNDTFNQFFQAYPDLTLFGEWLVPHTLKTYRKDAWQRFYVFDVIAPDGYLPYNKYAYILDEFGFDYIPPLAVIQNPTEESLTAMLERNVFLIEDGLGSGEGIVIKNYDYKNKYGRITWAKIVKNEFKEKHWHSQPTEVKAKDQVEEKIVEKYVTLSLVEKELSKMGEWSTKMIPRLLSTIFYCLVKEESWNFVKDFKNPIIDYRRLNQFTILKVKQLKPELF